ncbi:D-2-hydroxyacid dehydrogenase [Serpentinicella sp. ANB-PHB4]|uniref:D-2-hydroxyacid dehydrogenase n=1 Tax=Serpentinicella sp. ANB-PHB4 TaxID=3074076 RepID=UPI002858F7AE|nr:D-2-hydroxyacid dehydrogenase [Serpentinicella sp. ANB-PHB4]MDR5658381.1 D-2-hydroxyacid dehydrogenase [Serpentinicella sp. ANB-PHB4]
MKIVVLDGYTLNPGDLSWDKIKELGEVEIYDRTPSRETVKRAKDADIILTNKTALGEKELSQLDKLKYIGVTATGYNVVDIKAARERNITVTNIPTYGTGSVAQMTFALILELTQRVKDHSEAVLRGEWNEAKDFCFWKQPLIELQGKTLGIIGFGRIGQAVADIATAFGMNIIAYNTNKSDQSHRKNFKWVEFDTLFKDSDIVSLHCPLKPETEGIINYENLKKMKGSAFLINTSRGQLIIEEDLANALNNNLIAGAGLDVLAVEPPKPDNPLLKAKNCIITPHIAWATFEARSRLMDIAVDNLKMFLNGEPINVVISQ